jgi:hypothetical protein
MHFKRGLRAQVQRLKRNLAPAPQNCQLPDDQDPATPLRPSPDRSRLDERLEVDHEFGHKEILR